MRLSFGVLILITAIAGFSFSVPEGDLEDSIEFEIKNAGITVEGKFTEFEIDIDYSSDNPNSSTFNAKIYTSSLRTGISLRDEHLTEKEEFFNAEKYPLITFNSTRTTLLTDGRLKVEGTLKIKATQKAVQLIVTPLSEGAKTYFETTLELDRLDYDVGESSWVMSDGVVCKIRAGVN